MTDIWSALIPSTTSTTSTTGKDAFDKYFEMFDEPATEKQSECPECKSTSDTGMLGHDIVCSHCGVIMDTPLDQGAEFRWFSSDLGAADPSRCGFPVNPLFPESSLGTIILSKCCSKKMRTVALNHSWGVMPSRERTLWKLFECFQIRMSNVGISLAIQEESKLLFAQFTASTSCRGESQRNALFAACVWEAFKRHETPRLPQDIAELFDLPLKHLIIAVRNLQQTVAKRTAEDNTSTYTSKKSRYDKGEVTATTSVSETALHRKALGQQSVIHSISYENYIKTFMLNLLIPRHVAGDLMEFTLETCDRIIKIGVIPENTPTSLSAAALIFCAQHLETPLILNVADVSRACHVSCVTLQKSVKRLNLIKEKLLNK